MMDERPHTHDEGPRPYCIRCGKLLDSQDIYYSKNDPDGEEPLCRVCYKLKG